MTLGGKGKTVLIIMAALACFILIKYILVSDEARIKRVIYKGKAAIEREDFEGALKHVSRDYRDDLGFNKLAIGVIIKRVFNEFDTIAIHVEDMEIEISETRLGQATLFTWVTAQGKEGIGYIVGSMEKPSRVIFTLAKEGRHWRIVKVEGVEPGEVWL